MSMTILPPSKSVYILFLRIGNSHETSSEDLVDIKLSLAFDIALVLADTCLIALLQFPCGN